MTNEEIVLRIQRSSHEDDTENLYIELWYGIRNLVYLKAAERVRSEKRPSDLEDILQECYLQLPDAVKRFNIKAGMKFSNYFSRYFFPRAASIALYGSRTSENDPLNSCISLDEPLQLSDNENITLIDLLVDTESELPYQVIDEVDFWKSVEKFIHRGIAQLPEKQRKILRFMYENDTSCSEAFRQKIAGDLSQTRYAQIKKEGLANLRKWIEMKARNEAEKIGVFDILSLEYFIGGLDYYKSHNYTSNVEEIALHNAEQNEKSKGLDSISKVLR